MSNPHIAAAAILRLIRQSTDIRPAKPRATQADASEPAFLVLDVRSDKVLIRLGQVDDSFDKPYDASGAAGYKCDHNLDDALGGISENEFVNAKTAQQNAADTGDKLLIGAHRLPALHLALVNR